jgi:hypothetical protein
MRISAVAIALVVLSAAASADPMPVPKADFSAAYTLTGRAAGGGNMAIRHSGGKMRLEITAAGGVTATGYFDIATRKAVMVMALPGTGQPIAMEMDANLLPQALSAPEGRKTGSQRIGGETCDVWENDASGVRTVSCITPDGLLLRSESRKGNELVALLELVELSREKQDPAALSPPKNVRVMRMPAGVIPGMKP